MSTTQTYTSTQSPSGRTSAPEFTVLTRVVSIPMISSSLETINDALLSNAYTRSPYSTAKDLSTTAYKYTEPLQIRLAPLIVQADGFANKAVDVVESRYPYPFKAKPEEVATLVRERKQSATDYVNERTAHAVTSAKETIDEKVKVPAYNVAQGIDQRFSPIIDYLEIAVSRFNSESGPSNSPESKYQYQRALALSKTLKDNLYVYSNDQIKHLQNQSVLVQRATETAHSITTLASSSLTSAQTRINTLSDTMLVELQKLQNSTAALSSSLQSSASTTIYNSTSQLQSQIPSQIQQTYADISGSLLSAATDLRAIITAKDLSLQDRATRVGQEVRDRVSPLLDTLKKGVSDVLSRVKAEIGTAPSEVTGDGVKGSNGHMAASQ